MLKMQKPILEQKKNKSRICESIQGETKMKTKKITKNLEINNKRFMSEVWCEVCGLRKSYELKEGLLIGKLHKSGQHQFR